MSANPQTSGTGASCRLPYMKKPSPTELNKTTHKSVEVSNLFKIFA